MRTLFVNTRPFWKFSYGAGHPFKLYRLFLVQKMQELKGLLEGVSVVEPEEIDEEKLLLFHTEDYIRALRDADSGVYKGYMEFYGLGYGDNPIFVGVYTYSKLVAGASYKVAYLVGRGFERGFNIAGGLHHAMPSRAYGFCYLNDPVMAVYTLLERYNRVLYIDVDGHHGDGVQLAFYTDDRVLTVSLHESGRYLFPGTGFAHEMGEGRGYGFALNVPFPPGSGDDVYEMVLEEVVFPAVEGFSPQVVVSQLGADTLSGDPLTHWNLTLHSYTKVLGFLDSLKIPWVALGGGGYNMGNVVKAWTWALAFIARKEITPDIPPEWDEIAKPYGVKLSSLYDEDRTSSSSRVWEDVRETVRFLKDNHPLLLGIHRRNV